MDVYIQLLPQVSALVSLNKLSAPFFLSSPVCVLSCIQPFDPVVCSLPGCSVNTEVGCHFLLHRIFPAPGSNLCFLQPLNWQVDSFTTEPPEKRSPPSSGMPITLLLPFLIELDSSYRISSLKKKLRSLSSPTYIIIKFLFKLLFIYFWLHWVFVVMCGLLLVGACGILVP